MTHTGVRLFRALFYLRGNHDFRTTQFPPTQPPNDRRPEVPGIIPLHGNLEKRPVAVRDIKKS